MEQSLTSLQESTLLALYRGENFRPSAIAVLIRKGLVERDDGEIYLTNEGEEYVEQHLLDDEEEEFTEMSISDQLQGIANITTGLAQIFMGTAQLIRSTPQPKRRKLPKRIKHYD